jgi:replicative DNA helicase Mcm
MNDYIAKELTDRYNKNHFLVPHSEITRLKRFMEVFNELRQLARSDSINQLFFVNALVNTANFTPEEAEAYIKKAMENGQIYEKRSGLLAKA